MNRRLVISIIAIILAVMMILSVVLAALPSNVFGTGTAVRAFADACKTAPAILAAAA